MSPASVAIILCTFNGASYLKSQLHSLASQEDVTVSVFAFDDNSHDETIKILNQARDYLDITITTQEQNSGGAGKNFLRSISFLKSDILFDFNYFALCDQDDIWLPDKLISAINSLNKSSSSLYYSSLMVLKDNRLDTSKLIYRGHAIKKFDHLFEGGSAGCTYVLTNDLFFKLRESISSVELGTINRLSHDWIIYMLAKHFKFKVFADPIPHILYRIHNNNVYGSFSLIGIRTLLSRFHMLRHGFYDQQISNSLLFLDENSVEYRILTQYQRSRLQRLLLIITYWPMLFKRPYKIVPFLIYSLLV